jgi:hypothetical protein
MDIEMVPNNRSLNLDKRAANSGAAPVLFELV